MWRNRRRRFQYTFAITGAAAVWLVSLVFFQAVLLAGYAFAHVSIRVLGLRRQTVAQLLLVLAPLPLLPVALPAHASPPAGSPTRWLLGLRGPVRGRPVLPLRGRERRQPPRPACLSVRDRAAAHARRAGEALGGR